MAEQKPEARHLVEMLRRHYQPDNRPPAGVFAPEIRSPCGKRRADLIWMPTTVAGGEGLHGHEVKVARSDVLTELADPTKADPWARYCTRWWLVVLTPDLVNGLDIPDAWGVMTIPSGRRTRTMTVVKPAPKLTPRDPAPGAARLAAWQLHHHHQRVQQLEYELGRKRAEVDRLRQQVATMQTTGAVAPSRKAERVARILRDVELRLHAEDVWSLDGVSEEAVVAALVDHEATAAAAASVRRNLRGLVARVQQVVDPFKHVAAEVQKAEKLAAQLSSSDSAERASPPG